MADDNKDIEFDKDGGGTMVTVIVSGLILLMVIALGALLYLAFAN
ncbi:hypothetical protein GCM10010172_55160 [Paractinoplanes ferrugineus]|uniref:Uncharacterized protein n=1 Tax=Paractinoplanes ferrugineus TaxID=113564 RepID=A0A919MCS3_9ACTN|nr:hypothetical protein [Actinoplanes ferrugineus]GIE11013.1 hypothetical protein Afe05nite_28530 [Actinoplanes ferrugineus]